MASLIHFERLGIDVWMRRAPARAASVAAPEATRAVGSSSVRCPAPAPAVRRRPPVHQPKPRPDPGPRVAAAAFRVRCFHCAEVFAAIGEDAWPRRRFIMDVVHAVNRFVACERRELLFEWPQPGADPAGHRRAYRAFFLHQMRTCSRSIVAGATPAKLLGHEPPARSGPLGSHFYVAPVEHDGAAKKRLWEQVRVWLEE